MMLFAHLFMNVKMSPQLAAICNFAAYDKLKSSFFIKLFICIANKFSFSIVHLLYMNFTVRVFRIPRQDFSISYSRHRVTYCNNGRDDTNF